MPRPRARVFSDRFQTSRVTWLSSDDSRSDEDDELLALIARVRALEEPTQKRNLADTRRLVEVRRLGRLQDAADGRRDAVGHLHLRFGALRVDRRVAVDRAAEVGNAV